jgi:FdhD protein
MRHRPQSAKPTQVTEWNEGRSRSVLDELAVEEPLEIRANGQSLGITMRTPGHDFELAAGLLLTEGVVASAADLVRIEYGSDSDGATTGNLVDVEIVPAAAAELARLRRATPATSACGVCGRASIEGLRARGLAPLGRTFDIEPAVLTRLPASLGESQRVFRRTGGLHAAALFDIDGSMMAVREDIGRHNAVDKIVGWALLSRRMPLTRALLVISGRGGFEIVQKAVVARICAVASVSAPSSLAVQLAREFNLTLVGFLRGQRFVVYAGAERVKGARSETTPT